MTARDRGEFNIRALYSLIIAASPLGRPTAPLEPFFLLETEDFLGRPTGLLESVSLSILYSSLPRRFLGLFLILVSYCLLYSIYYIILFYESQDKSIKTGNIYSLCRVNTRFTVQIVCV